MIDANWILTSPYCIKYNRYYYYRILLVFRMVLVWRTRFNFVFFVYFFFFPSHIPLNDVVLMMGNDFRETIRKPKNVSIERYNRVALIEVKTNIRIAYYPLYCFRFYRYYRTTDRHARRGHGYGGADRIGYRGSVDK